MGLGRRKKYCIYMALPAGGLASVWVLLSFIVSFPPRPSIPFFFPLLPFRLIFFLFTLFSFFFLSPPLPSFSIHSFPILLSPCFKFLLRPLFFFTPFTFSFSPSSSTLPFSPFACSTILHRPDFISKFFFYFKNFFFQILISFQ